MKNALQTLRRAAGFLFLLLWAMGSSCAKPARDGVSPSPGEKLFTATPELQIVLMESWIDFELSSFYELASYSHAIILGRVVSMEGIINLARWGDDRSQPADHFSVGQVYLVEVEIYFKGEGPALIYLMQGQGKLLRKLAPGETPHPDEIEQAKAEAEGKDFIPLKPGNRYLFFLRLFDDEDYDVDGYRANQLYIPAGVPWKFYASDLEHIRYEEGDPDRSFPADLPLDEVIAQINAIPIPPAYPPPQATSADLPYPPPRPNYIEEPPPDTPTPTPDPEAALPEMPPAAGFPAATLHRGEVWLVEHGRSPQALTAFGDVEAIFGWDHSGTKLLIGRGLQPQGWGASTELWLLEVDTAQARPLTDSFLVKFAAWSPVEDRLAYCEEGNILRVIDLEGNLINQRSEMICSFNWSPDGAAIAASTYTPDMVDWDGLAYNVLAVWWLEEDRLQVFSDAKDESHGEAIWSMDGRRILFMLDYHGTNKRDQSGFHLADVAQGRIQRLEGTPMSVQDLSRSPRADRVVYRHSTDIYLMDFEGRFETIASGLYVVWLPDGKTLLYRAEDGSYRTVVVEVELAETAAGGERTAIGFYIRPGFFFKPGGG